MQNVSPSGDAPAVSPQFSDEEMYPVNQVKLD
jgi:hypothetical protein